MAAIGWALWKTWHDLVFSTIVIKSPKQVATKSTGFSKAVDQIGEGRVQEGSLGGEAEGRASTLVICS